MKGTAEDAWVVAQGEQVTRYWGKYRQVLITNYRDFVLIGQDAEGKPVKLETYRLAPSEGQFWNAANLAKTTADRVSESFHEFLKRVLLNTAVIATRRKSPGSLPPTRGKTKFRTEEGRIFRHLPLSAPHSRKRSA